MTAAVDDLVLWHDLECGAYVADLPLWRELAGAAAGPILDVGAGSGRVAIDLARHGHEVVALDREPALLDALTERARDVVLPPETVCADARDLDLRRHFACVLVPMQTIQLLGGEKGRARFLGAARRHLMPGATIALALADAREGWSVGDVELPPPDMVESAGWVHASQPVAVRERPGGTAIERVRQSVAPDGRSQESRDVTWLDRLDAEELEGEGRSAGLHVQPRRTIASTPEHVGSEVVILRA